ncbi:Rha family transcriptional regulator [Romboutsia lituseburensis]|uniref:Rha family transcriptional regulator n=1 Tax=Romboutsia lituseburensis TaxID=1537 RepID=UPI00215A84B7|nr:Rha family transcriptional regulator [Romboutsia lituseburensis]MCR8744371.1 ORF6C domain-containing protein [Romboutsia lituseburensis]
MNELIHIQEVNGTLLVSSRDIAKNFEREHKSVIRSIEDLAKADESNLSYEKFIEMFVVSSYLNRGKTYKEYYMTRDGFSLLVMGFTGAKALNWKLKYIEAFNKMEQQLREQSNPYANLSKELQMIIQLDQKQQMAERKVIEVANNLEDFKNNAPLFNSECDELIKCVKKTATRVLGGYKSNAYNDKSIRAKVYSDIQQQIRRQFGVESYKAIKRVQLHKALDIVADYEAPIVLAEEVEILNSQLALA